MEFGGGKVKKLGGTMEQRIPPLRWNLYGMNYWERTLAWIVTPHKYGNVVMKLKSGICRHFMEDIQSERKYIITREIIHSTYHVIDFDFFF